MSALESSIGQIHRLVEALAQSLIPEQAKHLLRQAEAAQELATGQGPPLQAEDTDAVDSNGPATMQAFLDRNKWTPEKEALEPQPSLIDKTVDPPIIKPVPDPKAWQILAKPPEPNSHEIRATLNGPPRGFVALDSDTPGRADAYLASKGKLLRFGTYPDIRQAEFVVAYAVLLETTLTPWQRHQDVIRLNHCQASHLATLRRKFHLDDDTKAALMDDVELYVLDNDQTLEKSVITCPPGAVIQRNQRKFVLDEDHLPVPVE